MGKKGVRKNFLRVWPLLSARGADCMQHDAPCKLVRFTTKHPGQRRLIRAEAFVTRSVEAIS